MIPAKKTNTDRKVIELLNSRWFVLISIISSLLSILFCIIANPRSTLANIIDNSALYVIISFIALKQSVKKREQENETFYRSRTNKQNPYQDIPLNTDIYIASAFMFGGIALLIARISMLWLGVLYLILAFGIFLFGIAPAIGNSMLPTIGFGDWIIMERWFFFRRTIKRGDIVMFARPPGLNWPAILKRKRRYFFPGPNLVKRVIAMSDETISMTDGKIYINSKLLEEDKNIPPALYELQCLGDLGKDGYKSYPDPQFASNAITVPKGHYFVLGDFRINENIDSHIFGFVPEKQILGRMITLIPIGAQGIKIKRTDLYVLVKHLLAIKQLILNKKFEEVIEECNKAIAIYEECAPAYGQRALAKQGLEQFDQAIDDCNKSILLYKTVKDPTPGLSESIILPYSIRSTTYTHLKKYKEALQDCNTVVKLSPREVNAYINRAKLFYNMQKYKQALDDCNQAIMIAPLTAGIYHLRAQVKLELNQYDEAFKDCEQALELKPDDVEVYANKALIFLRQQKVQQAIDCYNQAEQLKLSSAALYFVRAQASQQLDQFQDAYDYCNRAIELDSTQSVLYASRGSAAIFLKQWDKALDDLNKAIDMGSDSAVSRNNRSVANFELEHYEQSMQDCEQAIQFNPKLGAAYKNRARILMHNNNYKLALDDLNEAIKLTPDRGDFYYYRGQIYNALGDNLLAKNDLIKAADLGYVS